MNYNELQKLTTPSEIETWAAKDFIVAALMNTQSGSEITKRDNYAEYTRANPDGNPVLRVRSVTNVLLNKFANDGNRKIGYIQGVHDDGSLHIAILGTGVIPLSSSNFHYAYTQLGAAVDLALETREGFPLVYFTSGTIDEYRWSTSYVNPAYGSKIAGGGANIKFDYPPITGLTSEQAVLYQPSWQPAPSSGGDKPYVLRLFYRYGKRNGAAISGSTPSSWQLTTSPSTTIEIGDDYRQYYFCPTDTDIYTNGYANIGGVLVAMSTTRAYRMAAKYGGGMVDRDWSGVEFDSGSTPVMGTYASHYTPFNIPLSRNLEECLTYIENGTLPSDAFLYPFDTETIPINNSGEDPDPPAPTPEDPGGDEPGETGTEEDDLNPTPTVQPLYSPQSLTNNNLYWLSSLELKNFIDWFWTDATDVASWSDLLDKIMGLYENLSQALISVRYMPVDISWCGGVTAGSTIIVGPLEKTQVVNEINKTTPSIRNIGTIAINPRYNGSFANYSPYAQISLYLPFHGFIDLDVDMVMGKTLAVQCAYDIMSGTIQYFIFMGGYSGQLINEITAKMSVEIPLSLQTKTDRDSAVYQNVASTVSSLAGAGASLATGSPIGLVMSMGNIAGANPQAAPLNVKGTAGETGAFYQPQKCAVYIKRPNYNRPDCYASRVGYPANRSRRLSSCKGFTQVYNPTLTFTQTVKPYKSEIDEIYAYLEKGVII